MVREGRQRPRLYEKEHRVSPTREGSQDGLDISSPQMEVGLGMLPTALRIPTVLAVDRSATSRSPGPWGEGGRGISLLWVKISPEMFSFTDGIFLECH